MSKCPVSMLKVLHYPVRLEPDSMVEKKSCYGEYSARLKAIFYDPKYITGQTMVHEVSHAIKDAANIENPDDKKDEDNSLSLECLVATFIADNAEFCKWLIDEIVESFNGKHSGRSCGGAESETGESHRAQGNYKNTHSSR